MVVTAVSEKGQAWCAKIELGGWLHLYNSVVFLHMHDATLHYTTLHYTTLHYTPHHITLHYTTLHYSADSHVNVTSSFCSLSQMFWLDGTALSTLSQVRHSWKIRWGHMPGLSICISTACLKLRRRRNWCTSPLLQSPPRKRTFDFSWLLLLFLWWGWSLPVSFAGLVIVQQVKKNSFFPHHTL